MARRGDRRRSDDDEAPSLAMVLSGGLGVLAVVAFVAALALGTEVSDPPPGARLGIMAVGAGGGAPGDGAPGDDAPGDDAPGDDAPGDDVPGDDAPGGGPSDGDGTGGVAIVAPRCQAERVTVVELRAADGSPVWRVTSPKGSIDERYVVGAADPPFGFVTDVAAPDPLPSGLLTAGVALDGEPFAEVHEVTFDPAEVPPTGVHYRGRDIGGAEFEAQTAAAANCQGSGRDLGAVTLVFVAAAFGVVVTYVMMVARYVKGRGGP